MTNVVRHIEKKSCTPLGSGNRFNGHPIEVYQHEDDIFITAVSIKGATGFDLWSKIDSEPGIKYKLNKKKLLVKKSTLYSWRFTDHEKYKLIKELQDWVHTEQYLLEEERTVSTDKSVKRESLKVVPKTKPKVRTNSASSAPVVVEKVIISTPDVMEDLLEEAARFDTIISGLRSKLRKATIDLGKVHLEMADAFVKQNKTTERELGWFTIRNFLIEWGVNTQVRRDYPNLGEYTRGLGNRVSALSRKCNVIIHQEHLPKGVRDAVKDDAGGYGKRKEINVYREDMLEQIFFQEFGEKVRLRATN